MTSTIQKLSLAFSVALATTAAATTVSADALTEARAAAEALSAVAVERDSIIAGIIATWQDEPLWADNVDVWMAEFEDTLNRASNAQLLAIQGAASYSEVQGILLGGASSDGFGTEALGDTSADLVFTPTFPCRFYDSRPSQGGAGAYQGTRSYLVYGTGAQLAPQGGNAAGCPAPAGEPAAIAANFTVVPQTQSGHITPFPYGGTLPTASFVNYYPGTNIANAGLLATCYNCALDLSVFHFSTTHSLADVMGFYYPASSTTSSNSGPALGLPGPLPPTAIPTFVGPTTSIAINRAGQKVMWHAQQALGTLTTAAALDLMPCYRLSGSTAVPTTVGAWMLGHNVTGNNRLNWSVSAEVAPPATGNYDFGMCYMTPVPTWDNNEFGYVTAERL